MAENWFEDAAIKLKVHLQDQLKEQPADANVISTNGLEYLIDYLTDSPPNEDIAAVVYSGEEELDKLVRAEIDNFESWLNANAIAWLVVGKRYKWILKTQEDLAQNKDKIVTTDNTVTFTAFEEMLLRMDVLQLGDDASIRGLKQLYNKALDAGDDELIYECAVRISWGYDKANANKSDRAQKWEEAGEKAAVIGKQDGYRWFIKAAEYRCRNHSHGKAAALYRRAAELGNLEKIGRAELLEIVRNGRKQFELAGDESQASKEFIKESDLVRQTAPPVKKTILFFYKYLANYGESPFKVALWSTVVVLLCAGLYAWAGIASSVDGVKINELTYLYYSIVTFTTLGYGDFRPANELSQMISAFQALAGLILTSLFLVTVVKKYSR
ncbi:MAG: hypothetical protein HRT35_06220 [Algicola sp.]|nr:hypothetical protein [Algicola sp.]